MCWTIYAHAIKCISVPAEIQHENKPHKVFSERPRSCKPGLCHRDHSIKPYLRCIWSHQCCRMMKRVEECEDPLRCISTISMRKYEQVATKFVAADTWHRPFSSFQDISDFADQLRVCIRFNHHMIAEAEESLAESKFHMGHVEHNICKLMRSDWPRYRRFLSEPMPGPCNALVAIKQAPEALEELKMVTDQLAAIVHILVEKMRALDASVEVLA